MIISKGGIPLQVFPASCRKYFNFKIIFYQVNYNFSGKPPYFPATCLKYNNYKYFRQVAGNILTLKLFSIKLTTILVGNPLTFRQLA